MKAQNKTETKGDLARTFMPAVQMGYVAHGTDQLSGGLMIQTSIEYRDISNFVFRINYDDFKSNMNVEYPLNSELSFTGRNSFSEFIGGVGLRDKEGQHHFTGYIQGGIRLYGYPIFTTDNTQTLLDYDSRNVGLLRYSLGYEYEINSRLFFTMESLISHTLSSKDFWEDNIWSYGLTVGLTAPI